MKLTLIPVPPIGTHQGIGCGHGGCRPLELPSYPESPKGRELREEQLRLGLSLRQGAERLGLTAVKYSQLCRGASTLSAEEWEQAMQMIREEP